MNNPIVRRFIPVIAVFVFINLLILFLKALLIKNGFSINFLLIANLILFAISASGFFVQTKAINSPNINAFIRAVYASLIIKMFVILGAVLIYLFVTGGKVNKPSLFTSMALYLIYTSIEVAQLMKITRRKPNG